MLIIAAIDRMLNILNPMKGSSISSSEDDGSLVSSNRLSPLFQEASVFCLPRMASLEPRMFTQFDPNLRLYLDVKECNGWRLSCVHFLLFRDPRLNDVASKLLLP